MVVPFFDSARQDAPIQQEINEAILRVSNNHVFVAGEETIKFEEAWAAENGVQHCVFLSSGTAALEIALRCCNLDSGKNIAVTSNSFYASCSCIITIGSNPIFCDTDNTCNIDLDRLELILTRKRTYNIKGVIAVNLYSNCLDHDRLYKMCQDHNVPLVLDLCQSVFSMYKGRHPETLCDVSTHSFYLSKTLGCYGEGGCLLTNNDKIADTARCIRNHGMTKEPYKHFINAGNQRGIELQTSILNVKLKHKDHYIDGRIKAVEHYKKGLSNFSNLLLKENPYNTRMVNFVFPIFTDERNALRKHLTDNQIGTNIHYPIPLNLQPVFQGGRYRCNYLCPNAKKQCETELSLPLFVGIIPDEQNYVISKIHEFFREYEYPE